MSRTIVIVPCFNEARRLDLRCFEEHARVDPATDFLFVNDGSQDETLTLLRQLHAADARRFRYLDLPKNRGKAEAVRQGMLQAFAEAPRYVGFWDADLATPLCDIGLFRDALDSKPTMEMVIGTRMKLLGRAIERRRLRNVCGRVFANCASFVLRANIYDTQCGAKLFRLSDDLQRVCSEPFLARWIFDVEIFARLSLLRYRLGGPGLEQVIYEQPLDQWRDVAGSKLRPRDFATSFVELSRIYWRYLRPRAPLPADARPPLPCPAAPAPHFVSAADPQPADRQRAA